MPSAKLTPSKSILLFCSFQRYAFLLAATSIAPFGLTLYFLGFKWWALLLSLIFFLPTSRIAYGIAKQWPVKFLVVKRAYAHLSRGQFKADHYQKYCTDRCWLLVVNHILKTAGKTAPERKKLLAEYAKQTTDISSMMIVVDRDKGVVKTIDKGKVQTQAMEPAQSGAPSET